MITKLENWKNRSINESNDRDWTKEYIDKNNMVEISTLGYETKEKLVQWFKSDSFLNKLKSFIVKHYDLKIEPNNFQHEYQETKDIVKLKLITDEMTDNMGVFTNVIKSYSYGTFGRMELNFIEWQGQFYCRKEIWCPNISISYEAISGGSNGMTVTPPSNQKWPNFWWDIETDQAITK